MKRLFITSIATLLCVSLQVASAQQTAAQSEKLLAAAQHKATVDGDLKGAIEDYKKIAANAGANRALAAQALIAMADCYQKLGDTQSRTTYERVVREFADQKQAVAIANANLGGGLTAGMISRKVWNADTYGAVSPDGRYISFLAPAAFRGIPVANVTPGALAVHDLRSGANREIDRNHDGPSVFSRDGRSIAYTVFNEKEVRYQLRFASVDGDANPRLVFDNPDVDWIGAYDWSPDNRSVVVLLKRKDRTAQIGFVSVPDGSLRVLKSVDWRGTGRIFLTPDGKYLGYDLPAPDNTREHHVFVLSADGSRETTAIAHASLNYMMGWSGDGSRLLFSSNRTGTLSLWAIPVSEGKVQGAPELIRADIGQVESMGVTRTGSFYYGVWSGSRPTSSIQIASLEAATGRVLATTSVPKEPAASDTQPLFSPDGSLLAYLSDRGTAGSTLDQLGLRNFVLVIRATQTTQAVREFDLNLSAANVRLKRWTPDGNGILISGVDAKGRPGLFRVDAQTGGMSVVGFVDLRPPNEWPDGEWRVSSDASTFFTRRRPDCEGKCDVTAFYRRVVATGAETELSRARGLGAINLSPNDRYIATAVPDPSTNSRTLVVIPTNGDPQRELMRVATGNKAGEADLNNKGRNLYFMAWSPDSESVFIRETMDGTPVGAWRVRLDGAPPQKLDWGADRFAGRDVAIHPDGTKIAYVPASPPTDRSLSEIWVLENFLRSGKMSK